ncbi:hypothetical protein ACO2Q0_00390 [Phenylobacterium sp. VNQ135]|uniref:hypothetical protein n=1 Tax=Phenylobacterium sp. VNQ135 TaxID=3400922 RepID=UPI003C11C632
MADEFERRLERLFGEAPELPDCAAFAQSVESKLNRGWQTRRWLIGAGGVVGGVTGASQLVMSNLFQRVETAEESARALTSSLTRAAPSTEMISALSGGFGIWLAVGLAVLLMGFALSRVIEEI